MSASLATRPLTPGERQAGKGVLFSPRAVVDHAQVVSRF